MKTQERVSKALRLLYKNALEIRQDVDIFKNYSDLSYLHEYGTIKLCSHRQAGHTTSIVDLIEKYSQEPFCIIWNSKRQKDYIQNLLDERGIRTNVSFLPFSFDENAYRGLNNHTIIVDMSSFIFNQKKTHPLHKHKKYLEKSLNKTNILIYLQ